MGAHFELNVSNKSRKQNLNELKVSRNYGTVCSKMRIMLRETVNKLHFWAEIDKVFEHFHEFTVQELSNVCKNIIALIH